MSFGLVDDGRTSFRPRTIRPLAAFITVDALVSEAQWLAWVSALPAGADRDAIADARRNQLGGLTSYSFPVAIVSRHAPLEVLTSIFVTINQQGLRLSVFDLMVAKSWLDPQRSPPGFDLRERWNLATGRNSRLASAGWVSIRVWEHDSPDQAAARIERVVASRKP